MRVLNVVYKNDLEFRYLNTDVMPAHVQTVLDSSGLLKAIKGNPGGVGILNSEETIPEITPIFLPTRLKRFTGFAIRKKSVRPEVRKLFEYFKAHGLKSLE